MKVFQLEHPEYLWLLALAPIIAALWYFMRWKDNKQLEALGEPALIKQLMVGQSKLQQKLEVFPLDFKSNCVSICHSQSTIRLENGRIHA